MAKKDTETIRSKQHKHLDDIYASREPDLEVHLTATVEEDGRRKPKRLDVEFSDGVAIVDTNGPVRLDREGCLRAAKAFSKAAQAVA